MTIYIVKAPAVKVSIGAAAGNRIARFAKRGDVISDEGIVPDQLESLVKRGLLEEVVQLPEGDPSEKWTGQQLDLFASGQEPPIAVKGKVTEKLAAITAELATRRAAATQ